MTGSEERQAMVKVFKKDLSSGAIDFKSNATANGLVSAKQLKVSLILQSYYNCGSGLSLSDQVIEPVPALPGRQGALFRHAPRLWCAEYESGARLV